MILIKSLFSAFLMYSRIPVPMVEWKEENRRYSLCFFPFIGLFIGGLLIVWYWICEFLGIGTILYSVVCTILPIIITGGIHADGFCDVIDAQSSCQSRERKLEIMGDSHVGAFAIIFTMIYFLFIFGLFSEINEFKYVLIVSLSYVLSRIFSAFAAIIFKSAKKEGTLQSFVKPAYKRITIIILALILIITAIAMLITDVITGAAVILSGFIMFIYYRQFSYKNYGGITGDMAGYFLQLCEMAMLIAIVLSAKITGVIL